MEQFHFSKLKQLESTKSYWLLKLDVEVLELKTYIYAISATKLCYFNFIQVNVDEIHKWKSLRMIIHNKRNIAVDLFTVKNKHWWEYTRINTVLLQDKKHCATVSSISLFFFVFFFCHTYMRSECKCWKHHPCFWKKSYSLFPNELSPLSE